MTKFNNLSMFTVVKGSHFGFKYKYTSNQTNFGSFFYELSSPSTLMGNLNTFYMDYNPEVKIKCQSHLEGWIYVAFDDKS